MDFIHSYTLYTILYSVQYIPVSAYLYFDLSRTTFSHLFVILICFLKCTQPVATLSWTALSVPHRCPLSGTTLILILSLPENHIIVVCMCFLLLFFSFRGILNPRSKRRIFCTALTNPTSINHRNYFTVLILG